MRHKGHTLRQRRLSEAERGFLEIRDRHGDEKDKVLGEELDPFSLCLRSDVPGSPQGRDSHLEVFVLPPYRAARYLFEQIVSDLPSGVIDPGGGWHFRC